MERNLWQDEYRQTLPPFPCPNCYFGRLALTKEGINRKSPRHVIQAYRDVELDDMGGGQFHAFMVCQIAECGEVVSFIGNYRIQYYFAGHGLDNQPIMDEDLKLKVEAALPAPPLIRFSNALGENPTGHLLKSFELFWVDLGSCANRVRIVIETLLDQFGVPRQRIGKKNGKLVDMNLMDRIDELDAMKPGHADALQALREVGNVGSHEGVVAFSDMLDCYELLEATLEELLDDKRAKLAAKAAAIRARKGRPGP